MSAIQKKASESLAEKEEKVWKALEANKEELNKEREKNQRLERKIADLEKSVKLLLNDRDKVREKLQKNEEDKKQLEEKIEKVKKYAAKGLDTCIEHLEEKNKVLERDIGHMLITLLDSVKKERGSHEIRQGSETKVEEVFLHNLKIDRSFKVTKGQKWHPEMCALCIIYSVIHSSMPFKVLKVANIKGCLWIQFEEERDSRIFINEAARISFDEVLLIEEVPSQLCDLIKLMEEEKRWCSHKESF